MSFYDDSESVDKYIDMCEGYDGSNIYEMMKKHLASIKLLKILAFIHGSSDDNGTMFYEYRLSRK